MQPETMGWKIKKGKLSQISMPHSKIKIGVRHLSFIGIVADLDGRTMFHALETVPAGWISLQSDF